MISEYLAKKNALACIDWILNSHSGDKEKLTHWRKVKTEIEKL